MRTCTNRRFARLVISTVALLLVCVVASQPAAAETYHVVKGGQNGNSCAAARSRATAKLTIAEGLTCLRTGDTLYIGGGTYAEGIDSDSVSIPSGTSWNNVVMIAAYPGEEVILKPSGTSEVINLAHAAIQYVVFDGLTLDATNVKGHGLSLNNGANHIRVQNGEIRNSPNQGVLTTDGTGRTEYNELINLRVHHNGKSRLSHGFYISTSNNLIERNTLYANAGYGIHLYRGSSNVNNNRIQFNHAYRNSLHDCCAAGILVGSGKDNIAHSNITYENPYGIIAGFNAATNTKIYNNTVYKNLHSGIQIQESSSNTIIKNNIVYLNSTAIEDLGSRTTLSHNLTSDPKFINASVFDCRLQPGSVAIDAGESLNETAVDFHGISRPQGDGYDIGAYEYTETPALSIPEAPVKLQLLPE